MFYCYNYYETFKLFITNFDPYTPTIIPSKTALHDEKVLLEINLMGNNSNSFTT